MMARIGQGTVNNTSHGATNENSRTKKAQEVLEGLKSEAAVVYEPSKAESTYKTYNDKGHIYNKAEIDKLKSLSDAKLNELKNTVKAMLEKQGYTFEEIESILDSEKSDTGVKIDDETRLKAQEAISEDGFYGVKNTSKRILDFAKHISGDNPEKYEQIKQAIVDGFEAAKEAFGGSLPQISQDTYDQVMKGLDEWAGKDK